MATGSFTLMFKTKNDDLTILDFAQGGNLAIAVDAFMTDRKASGLTKHTIKFYQSYLTAFITYCDSLSIQNLKQINPDFLRRYLLSLEGKWNPGGIHDLCKNLDFRYCLQNILNAFFPESR